MSSHNAKYFILDNNVNKILQTISIYPPHYMLLNFYDHIQTQIFHYMIRSNKIWKNIKQKLRYFFARVQLYGGTSSVGFRKNFQNI